jgi:hypothetical protein
VTINGAIPFREIKYPFTPPQSSPPKTMKRSASETGKLPWTTVAPATALQKNMIEPTERSIPAVRSTKVIPIATMATAEHWMNMLRKLSMLRKLGERIPKIPTTPA